MPPPHASIPACTTKASCSNRASVSTAVGRMRAVPAAVPSAIKNFYAPPTDGLPAPERTFLTEVDESLFTERVVLFDTGIIALGDPRPQRRPRRLSVAVWSALWGHPRIAGHSRRNGGRAARGRIRRSRAAGQSLLAIALHPRPPGHQRRLATPFQKSPDRRSNRGRASHWSRRRRLCPPHRCRRASRPRCAPGSTSCANTRPLPTAAWSPISSTPKASISREDGSGGHQERTPAHRRLQPHQSEPTFPRSRRHAGTSAQPLAAGTRRL